MAKKPRRNAEDIRKDYEERHGLKRPRPLRHRGKHGTRKRIKIAARFNEQREATKKKWAAGVFDNRETRMGCALGKDRATCTAERAVAELDVQELMKMMEDEGLVEPVDEALPDSDEQIARKALEGVARLAFGPSVDGARKLTALRTLLDYTKAKPAQKIEAKVSSVEEWLTAVTKDNDG